MRSGPELCCLQEAEKLHKTQPRQFKKGKITLDKKKRKKIFKRKIFFCAFSSVNFHIFPLHFKRSLPLSLSLSFLFYHSIIRTFSFPLHSSLLVLSLLLFQLFILQMGANKFHHLGVLSDKAIS